MNIEKLRKHIQSLNKHIGKRPVGFYIHPAIRDDQPVHWVVEVDENRNGRSGLSPSMTKPSLTPSPG